MAAKATVVQLGGIEPPTSGSTIRRSNQLSYNCIRRATSQGRSANARKLGATPHFGKTESLFGRPRSADFRHIVDVTAEARSSDPTKAGWTKKSGPKTRTSLNF